MVPWNLFKPSSKIFLLMVPRRYFFCGSFMFFSVLCLLCLCLFICALWSLAGKGLTSWLSFVVSKCKFVTFPLVSWTRCVTWLYWFLIFAPLLTFISIIITSACLRLRTCNGLAVFWPTMDLAEILIYGGLSFALSHEHVFELTTTYAVTWIKVSH